MNPSSCRLIVLLSGQGSNLQAIIDRINQGELAATICCVISDKKDAYGLTRAQQHGIPGQIIETSPGETRIDYDQRLASLIDDFQPDWIILAGFMRILSTGFVERYQGRLINIHPSLLPKYKGLNTHQRVLDAGETEHGASVHIVTPELDDGPVISQEKITIHPDDNAESLKQRIHRVEHQLFPASIKLLCSGRISYNKPALAIDDSDITTPLTLSHLAELV